MYFARTFLRARFSDIEKEVCITLMIYCPIYQVKKAVCFCLEFATLTESLPLVAPCRPKGAGATLTHGARPQDFRACVLCRVFRSPRLPLAMLAPFYAPAGAGLSLRLSHIRPSSVGGCGWRIERPGTRTNPPPLRGVVLLA